MRNNDLTNDLQETKDWESRNPLKCPQRENWNNFFCRTVFFLAGLYSQYLKCFKCKSRCEVCMGESVVNYVMGFQMEILL
jgi:hypothetical protein